MGWETENLSFNTYIFLFLKSSLVYLNNSQFLLILQINDEFLKMVFFIFICIWYLYNLLIFLFCHLYVFDISMTMWREILQVGNEVIWK